MAQNSINLMSVLEHWFTLDDESASKLLMLDDGIILLPYGIHHHNESQADQAVPCIRNTTESISKPDVLVRIPPNNDSNQAKQEIIEQLKQRYRNNRTQLKLIEHFYQTYKSTDNEPIRWYTGKPFLYKQINRALRTEDIQMLRTFRYIISDISRCLKQEFEYIKEFVGQITLYRGLRVSNEELNKLKENVGKMISTNGFLSTSRSRAVALVFAGKLTTDKQSVLFEIECNLNELQNDAVIFADIARFSEIPNEEEVLFDIGAAFFMESVCYDNELNVWLFKLRAVDEAAQIAEVYLERNNEFIENDGSVSASTLLFSTIAKQ
ncbi:unnamed protein product [Didymodactylos carnosus]|uniref:ADP ribosyltransferase domain-containing protein n=1 Tax=Didymodactylos carnosus TaxID=1234261 RepID=A0A815N4P7_9BILA|nr:unnamed protein product [Didymodactylos carnosus]CAF1424768.1 unnamed protein product [Didymodactylos carnosus]CAF3940996.1 unnamed protein product [Didymodactylos carnosus]CAF4305995.1 unnamed protein product [Didymodactylos carnosus]